MRRLVAWSERRVEKENTPLSLCPGSSTLTQGRCLRREARSCSGYSSISSLTRRTSASVRKRAARASGVSRSDSGEWVVVETNHEWSRGGDEGRGEKGREVASFCHAHPFLMSLSLPPLVGDIGWVILHEETRSGQIFTTTTPSGVEPERVRQQNENV